MKLIIEIPDKMYKTVQDGTYCGSLYEELKNGIPVEQCGDCISREAALYLIADYDLSMGQVVKGIHALPPVTPQPKMGQWEWNQYDANPKIGNFHCSICHSIGRTYFDYCPYCGAKMSEIPTGAEGSDKE